MAVGLLLVCAGLNSAANADTDTDTDTDTDSTQLTPAVVLDFELLGETFSGQLQTTDQRLLAEFSVMLRQELARERVFDVIDDDLSLAVIAAESQHRFLHRCNGCELDIARGLGAKIVIAPWVFRMSMLIQTMYIEIRDVETGQLHLRKPYDFRGSSAKAWERAMRYALRDIKASAPQIRKKLN